MSRLKASFLSRLCWGVCLVLFPCVVEAILKDACPEEGRIILSPKERRDKLTPRSMRNLTLDLDTFPQDLKWFANGLTYGCMCDVLSCLRLCCPPGTVRKNATCTPANDALVQKWPGIYFKNLTLKPNDDFFPIVGYPCGKDAGYFLDPSGPQGLEDEYYLLDDGVSIYIAMSYFAADKYCLKPRSAAYAPILCFEQNSAPDEIPEMVHYIGIAFSIPFLLVTFIVYVSLPELNTIHGLTLRCYLACLAVSSVLLLTNRLASLEHSIWLCRFMAWGIYFSTIASFMWLNVMCIDIWRTFGNITFVTNSKRKRGKYVFYLIYAWGIAAIFSGVCILMDWVPGVPQHIIRPHIASSNKCWFASWKAEFAYFYGPMAVIVFCNILMFVATAIKMISHQKTVASRLNSNQNKHHHDAKKWFILYIKLFIVMGINWVTEVISWWWQNEDTTYLWYITDTVNTLQGLTIFLILVCKRKIIVSLKNRFKDIRRIRKNNELSLYSSSKNASRTTENKSSTYHTEVSRGTSTSESISQMVTFA